MARSRRSTATRAGTHRSAPRSAASAAWTTSSVVEYGQLGGRRHGRYRSEVPAQAKSLKVLISLSAPTIATTSVRRITRRSALNLALIRRHVSAAPLQLRDGRTSPPQYARQLGHLAHAPDHQPGSHSDPSSLGFCGAGDRAPGRH